MKNNIKLAIAGFVAIFALFAGVSSVSAQSATTTCTNAVWSATLYGTVTPNGSPTQAWFDWGTSTSLGFSTPKQTFSSNASYEQLLRPLAENTTYYYRAMAQNQYGTATGAIKSFSTGVCNTPIPAPAVDITVSPSSVAYNGTTLVNWTSSNATSCTASGGNGSWVGSKQSNGSLYVTGLTNTTTFGITCTNSTGSAYDSATVTVSPQVQNPTGTISATSCTISAGNYSCQSNINWNVNNPMSGANTGVIKSFLGSSYTLSTSLSGPGITNIEKGTTNFYLYHNGAELDSATATATCASNTTWNGSICTTNVVTPEPTVTITANPSSVNYNGSSTVSWYSTNATSCTASGGNGSWSGSKNTSGNFYTGSLTNGTTYYITCTGAGGTDSKSVTVTVGSQPVNNPIVNLTINPSTINSGNSTTISWNSTNATSCIGNGFNTGNNTSGSVATGALYGSQNYSITCTNSTGSAYDSAAVTVNTQNNNNTPTVDISADNTNVNYGSTTYVRWYSTNATSCTASGGNGSWSGSKNTTGSFYTGALYNSTSYTVICTNNSGQQASDQVFINVNQNNNNNNQTPTVTTNDPSGLNNYSATLNGYANSNGGSNVRAWFEWGTNSYSGNQTNQVSLGSGGSFNYYISGLSPNTTYYYRAIAQNDNGQIVYGNQRSFQTSGDYYNNNNYRPLVTTYTASNTQNYSATLNGYVDPNNTNATRWFEYGTGYNSLNFSTTRRSQGYSRGNFNEIVNGLSTNTTYYFRAVAQGQNGEIAYGNILNFRTSGETYTNTCTYGNCSPTAVTTIATNIGNNSARINGLGLTDSVVSNTGWFQYGLTTSLGRETERKYIGAGNSNPFFESLFSLAPGTTFYYRAVVQNQYGISYGEILSFRTSTPSTTTTNTNTNTNTTNTSTTNTTTTVVTNTQLVGAVKPSLIFLSINRNNETIRTGDSPEYVIYYKNVSTEDLRDVVLQVYLPKELSFLEASRGYYSEENQSVVVNIGNLLSGQEGSVYVRAKVDTNAEINKVIVVTANAVYTINRANTQEEVLAYSINTIVAGSNTGVELGALALLFGSSFLPSTLLGWMILILLIVLLILVIRRAYDKPVRVEHTHHNAH